MGEFASTMAIWALCLLVAVAMAIAIGRQGMHKGYPFAMGFFLSMAASPLVGWVMMTWLPEREKKKVSEEFLLQVAMEKATLELQLREKSGARSVS